MLSFSKGYFLSHFLYFSILLQIIHRISNINNFWLFLIQRYLIKTCATIYSYLSTSTLVELVLLINFYFSGTLLYYPIFLVPLDEFLGNNKQAQVIFITSRQCGQIFQFLNSLPFIIIHFVLSIRQIMKIKQYQLTFLK